MAVNIQPPRLHQLPSSFRQIVARNAHYTTLPRIATRHLSHAATRPQLGTLAAAHISQQQRNISIKQLDSGRDGEFLCSHAGRLEIFNTFGRPRTNSHSRIVRRDSVLMNIPNANSPQRMGRIYSCTAARCEEVPDSGSIAAVILRIYAPTCLDSSWHARVPDSIGAS